MAQGEVEPTYILSDTAKSIIRQRIRKGDFQDRRGATEPPFMAPSTKPDAYSKVRALPAYTPQCMMLTAHSGAQSVPTLPISSCCVLRVGPQSVCAHQPCTLDVLSGIQASLKRPLCIIAHGVCTPRTGHVQCVFQLSLYYGRHLLPSPQIGLQPGVTKPLKETVLERYDPPVLIIHVRWHETDQSFGKFLRDLLYLSYAGNEDSVSVPHPPHWLRALTAL